MEGINIEDIQGKKLKRIIGRALITSYGGEGVFRLEGGMIKPLRKTKDIIIQLK